MQKPYIQYHKDGSIWAKGQMTDELQDGYWEWFRKDGTLLRSGNFTAGQQVGEWITYDQRGQPYKVTTMKKSAEDLADVDAYIAAVPEPQQAELERIRAFIRQTVPEAVESISYGIPAFKFQGQPLMYYASFKDHMSIFPTASPTTELHDLLSNFKLSKGTIQFTLDNPIPNKLIAKILDYRLSEIAS